MTSSLVQEIKDDVDEHNRPVNNTLDIIAELVETGADVLSSAELNKLQQEGKQLKVTGEIICTGFFKNTAPIDLIPNNTLKTK